MNTSAKNGKPFDLGERTELFAKNVRAFIKRVPVDLSNVDDLKQLSRSSGSVAANFIEAHEALGKGSCLMHLRISRKEAKESMLWLSLIDVGHDQKLEQERTELHTESKELLLIVSAILRNSTNNRYITTRLR